MDKHCDIVCSNIRTQLGMFTNTRSLTLSAPDNKRKTLVKIILTTCYSARKSFKLREIVYLLGILAHLSIATEWAKCTCVALQHAAFLAIKLNSNILFSSGKIKQLIDILTSTNISIRNFYLAKSHKTVLNWSKTLFITRQMRYELDLLATMANSLDKTAGKYQSDT